MELYLEQWRRNAMVTGLLRLRAAYAGVDEITSTQEQNGSGAVEATVQLSLGCWMYILG